MSIQIITVRINHFPKGRWIGDTTQVDEMMEKGLLVVDGIYQEKVNLNGDTFVVEGTERQLTNADPDNTHLVANRDFMVLELEHNDPFEDTQLTILYNSDVSKDDIFGPEVPRILALIPEWIASPKPEANIYYHNKSDTNYFDLNTVWDVSIDWGRYDEDWDIDDFECKLVGHITHVKTEESVQIEFVKAA